MEKLDRENFGSSKDIVEDNIEKLKEIFPDVFSEEKIDFEKLREKLGEFVDNKQERYNFTWHGKTKAKKIAQKPSTGTLRPVKEESKNWDETENLYIEGDNLEVLKLLQKSYHNKVKMIYIDPPYNTGNDFVYKDDYKNNLNNYIELTEQVDGNGNKVSTNFDTSGRYHTNWLNMMYPRLKLARNLLKEDGVIFISIDDNEVHNLRKICDEIFGEKNFVGEIIRKTKSMTADKNTGFNLQHENLIIYSKNVEKIFLYGEEKQFKNYSNPDNDEKGEWTSADPSAKSGGESTYFKIENPYTGKSDYPPEGRYWAFSKDTLEKYIESGKIKFRKEYSENQRGFTFKRYKSELDSLHNPVNSLFPIKNSFMNQAGTKELQEIMENNIFDNPKPIVFIKKLVKYSTSNDDIILDFFSGSATTAHAIIKQNIEDNNNRKFIMVQLPEPTPEKSDARKADYKTISDIGKERIRRAGEKIKKEYKDNENIDNLDTGFKVFKLDSSNIKTWDVSLEDDLKESLFDIVDNIKDDRNEEDILYELLLKYGLDLTLPIEKLEIKNKNVYVIGFGALVICLDQEINLELVEEIGKLKEKYQPEIMRVVFKDSGFKNDVVKTNAIQILDKYNIDDVKSL